MKTMLSILLVSMVSVMGVKQAFAEDKPATSDAAKKPVLVIETTKGNIKVELDPKAAPKSVENVITYAKDGFYNGTIFHRVIPGFMIQGGGFKADMTEKSNKRASVVNEADNGLKNERGTIAMARTPDPNSATSQFFINVNDNKALDFTSKTPQGWGYAVFGKVTEGMDVVDSIVNVKTTTHGPHGDVPVEPIIMNKVTVVE